MPSEGAKHSAGVTHSGDLVRLDYDLWAEGGGRTELIDTTHQDVAQGANVPESAGHIWGPRPHLVGGDYFPTGIENALVGLKVGEELEREFTPADAFGERDPKLIQLFSMHEISRLPEMRREDAHLDVGTVLTIEGRRGRVVSLTQARVRVDFNPAFSGRKVRGKFKVTEEIHDHADQVRAVVDLQYGRGSEFQVEFKDHIVSIKVPERSKFDINWLAAKPRVIDRIRTQVHPTAIRVVEEYITPVEKEAPAAEGAGGKPAKGAAAESAPTGDKAPEAKHASRSESKHSKASHAHDSAEPTADPSP